MATAEGVFSFRVTLPLVPPGVYYLLVEAPREPVARTAFEVTDRLENRLAGGPANSLLILALTLVGLALAAIFRWRPRNILGARCPPPGRQPRCPW